MTSTQTIVYEYRDEYARNPDIDWLIATEGAENVEYLPDGDPGAPGWESGPVLRIKTHVKTP